MFDRNMSQKDFKRYQTFIAEQFGIDIPDTKLILLSNRIKKRLKVLGLKDYAAYFYHIQRKDKNDEELEQMINAVTTNTTSFFRHSSQYDYIKLQLIPQFKDEKHEKVKIWSAGCSTGQEAYSIAMTFEDYLLKNSNVDYTILCSDLSSKVLGKAKFGVYSDKLLSDLSFAQRKRFFTKKVKTLPADHMKVRPEIRKKMKFKIINLMDENYGALGKFDIVFCRNVLMYFSHEDHYDVIRKLYEYVKPGGYMFFAREKILDELNLDLTQIRGAIYQKGK